MPRIFAASLSLFFILASAHISWAASESLNFSPKDRVLVIAPHPDDETLGAGGIIRSAVVSGAQVNIAYLTHGESNELSALFFQKKPMILTKDFLKIGKVRKEEAVRAMAVLGVSEANLFFLGYPDLGTMRLWEKYWLGKKPFRSLFSRVNKVIHKDDYSYGQYFHGYNIVGDFEKVLRQTRPTHVFVTAPFDLNQDHQAAYLFLQTALLNLAAQGVESPAVHLYVVHAHNWPRPSKLVPEEGLAPPSSRPATAVRWEQFFLKPETVQKKEEALLNYSSQLSYSKNFLLSFVRKNEIYTDNRYETVVLENGLLFEDWRARSGAGTTDIQYAVNEKELFISIPLIYALDEMGTLSTRVFGYRKGISFTQMPKFHLKLFGNRLWAYNGTSRYFGGAIHYKVDKGRLLIRIPLELLKQPDHLFVRTHTAKNELSLDLGSWRVISIERPQTVDSQKP